MTEPSSAPTVQAVIDDAVAEYFDDCRGRVDGFIAQHFHLPGAWHTNKIAFGWDLLRAPVNLFWAPVYMVSLCLGWLALRLGWQRLGKVLGNSPTGLTTAVERHICELIYRDLLLGAQCAENPGGLHHAIAEALDELVQPGVPNADLQLALRPVINDALAQYGLTRTASADITNSVLSAMIGAFAFQKFTPGGMAVGFLLASWLAQQQAASNFLLGGSLGALYYGWFPVQPSLGFNLLGIALVLGVLAIFASFSGVISDPVQSLTGLHKYRLHTMIDHLQRDLASNSDNTFLPKDRYLARILEVVDAAKSQLV